MSCYDALNEKDQVIRVAALLLQTKPLPDSILRDTATILLKYKESALAKMATDRVANKK